MDFYHIKERVLKNGTIEVYPDFKVCRSKDIMIRAKSFYAIWDDEKSLWSTDEYDVQRLVDIDLWNYRNKIKSNRESPVSVKVMSDFSTGSWSSFRNYMNHISDNAHQLDENLTFLNTVIKKKDYVSKKLPYSLEEGSIESYDELISTLYEPEERTKLEWAIGSIIAGDAKEIQKFVVLYGEGGKGKSTMLNVIQKLFEGFYTTFEAKALTSNNNSFSTEAFKGNPLVAIQHDGDLSKIEDNTKLNSIISHEQMSIRELYKPSYTAKFNCFLFMGTNKPVKITDAKSGIIRRLIDVRPSGKILPPKKYHTLVAQIDFELGAIANHCLQEYRRLGKNYYEGYKPINMMLQTDVFFNFVESNFDLFKEQDGVSLQQAYELYKVYCDDSLIEFKLPKYKFRDELRNYFKKFEDRARVNGQQIRNYFEGFITNKFKSQKTKKENPNSIVLDYEESLLDDMLTDSLAQYANENETPSYSWSKVKTKLYDINTKELHYVKVPENHIVIDFDLKNKDGKKSLELNLQAASNFPATYTELSKSGSGVHLHYLFAGDAKRLSRVYSEGIEIKVFTGDSSLRRKLSKCNNIPVKTIKDGLPIKEEKVINFDSVKSEKILRDLIHRNLKKEIHPGTKPSIDFICKILDDAYKTGLKYDVSDLRPKILSFANNSSNQADYCLKLVNEMKFKSEEISEPIMSYSSNELIFFDVEVFPNLFVLVWKPKGKPAVRMINPKGSDIEFLLKLMLVGFNCRRYDNHIVYARYIGYDNEQLYYLSQKIINGSKNAMFGEAYNISYTDIYDFASAGNKMSLKKWEIKLGIHHMELGLPWDQFVPEELWPKVGEYCENDVIATEKTFDHLAGDWAARLILSDISGLTPNDTTNNHTIKLVFGDDKNTEDKLEYTDLSIQFPGYKFENGKSTYRGEEPSEGGYVYAEPGIYLDAAVLDIESMHPTTMEELNLFGPYTKTFGDLKRARLCIKNNELDNLTHLLDGKLVKYLDDPNFKLKDLSNALKTAINSAYGLTFAHFPNKFKDPRNVDNIVAKRGALFMIDLKHAVQEQGYTVAHIKTDSIKIPNATKEAIQFVSDFGKQYGYKFQHEETYKKMCLINDAVYIAQKSDGKWSATGAQFGHPYVFKTLFSKEQLEFRDLCETKAVTSNMYIQLKENDYRFVGKVGLFCPIKAGCGGGILYREKDGKYYSVTGTKGYQWLESDIVRTNRKEQDIDMQYFEALNEAAIKNITKFGDFNIFINYDKNSCPNYLMCDQCPYWVKESNKCKSGFECLPF